jgi:hypothetical protein
MNHSNSNFSFASIFFGFFALLFCGAAFFAMLAIGQIQNYNTFGAVFTFATINMIIVFVLALCGKYLSHIISTASLISIWGVTIIYTLLQFTHLGFYYKTISLNGYILFHLILLFVYLIIAISSALIGVRKNN